MHALHRFLTRRQSKQELDINSAELDQLIRLCWSQFGYDFSGYASASFKRRVLEFMKQQNLSSFAQLIQELALGYIPWYRFLDAITVNVTEMFRDPHCFDSFRTHVIPYLSSFPRLRIWIAGCSTGEEVYSIAILLQQAGLLERSVLFGTDINPLVIKQAQSGNLSQTDWERYAANYRQFKGAVPFESYFSFSPKSITLTSSLLEQMVFLPHNLVSDQSFNQFHLILCRNVCIYFDTPLQQKVAHLFDQSLIPLGFLMTGEQEQLSSYWRQKVQLFDATSNSYQKYPLSWKK